MQVEGSYVGEKAKVYSNTVNNSNKKWAENVIFAQNVINSDYVNELVQARTDFYSAKVNMPAKDDTKLYESWKTNFILAKEEFLSRKNDISEYYSNLFDDFYNLSPDEQNAFGEELKYITNELDSIKAAEPSEEDLQLHNQWQTAFEIATEEFNQSKQDIIEYYLGN